MAQRPQIPLFTSANGLHRLSMSELNPDRHCRGQRRFICLPENSLTFTNLASAINIGMEILETPEGRKALIGLGLELTEQWGVQHLKYFCGGQNQMAFYADHFLSAIRNDFPAISIDNIGLSDILTCSSRGFAGWNGDLQDYKPKSAMTISFNHQRVRDMIQASIAMDQPDKRLPMAERSAQRNKMVTRHKYFQFVFAIATAHEMCHAFLGYISQNGTLGGGTLGDLDTPPEITHLDYGASEIVGKNGVIKGEAGRWVENELFGGSLEFYRDHNDDDGQTGVPHVLDSYDVAWKINHQTILDFIENGREYRFPLRKTGEGFNRQERAQLQMRSLGNTIRVPAYDPQILFMKARSERPLSMDTLSEEE